MLWSRRLYSGQHMQLGVVYRLLVPGWEDWGMPYSKRTCSITMIFRTFLSVQVRFLQLLATFYGVFYFIINVSISPCGHSYGPCRSIGIWSPRSHGGSRRVHARSVPRIRRIPTVEGKVGLRKKLMTVYEAYIDTRTIKRFSSDNFSSSHFQTFGRGNLDSHQRSRVRDNETIPYSLGTAVRQFYLIGG